MLRIQILPNGITSKRIDVGAKMPSIDYVAPARLGVKNASTGNECSRAA